MGDIGTPNSVPIQVPAPPHRLPRVDEPEIKPQPVKVPEPEREPVGV